MMKRTSLFFFLIFLYNVIAYGQGYVDQDAVAPIINSQQGDIDWVTKAEWQVYEFKDHDKHDSLSAMEEFKEYIEDIPGNYNTEERICIIELANRVTANNFDKGRILLVPTYFSADYRAYSPYPFHYSAADTLPKLFIIDKYTQTFGAYENGKLVRWGLVSSGRNNKLTPAGRYNFNWKDEHRYSNAAPEGEVWEMFWVFNIQAKWGVHIHQYNLPIGYAASHGCVRTTEADAKWNYNWAHEWVVVDHKVIRNGTPVMILNDNPKDRPAHWTIKDGDVASLVQLPDNLLDIPWGIYAQANAAWQSGW